MILRPLRNDLWKHASLDLNFLKGQHAICTTICSYTLSHTNNITQRSCWSEANGDFTHAEKHSERHILYQKDACKFNIMKHINGEALPELHAIVVLED